MEMMKPSPPCACTASSSCRRNKEVPWSHSGHRCPLSSELRSAGKLHHSHFLLKR